MAEVFRAKDLQGGSDVAVKLLKSVNGDSDVSRFEREAKLLTQFCHPNLVKVHDGGKVTANLYYYVMEIVKGRSLRQIVKKEGPLPKDRVRDILKQVASALQCAHEAGVVHRDIKPSNVMMRDDGTVALIDFGVARLHKGTQLTKTGFFIGTIHYAAPEVLKGQRADSRTDIFALGIMTYELLTGDRPFPGQSLQELAAQIALATPRPLPGHVSGSRGFWQNFIDACLEKDPDKRLRDGKAVLDYLEEPQTIAAVAIEERDNRSLVSFAFFFVLLVACVFIYVGKPENKYREHIKIKNVTTKPVPGGFIVTWTSDRPYKSMIEVVEPNEQVVASKEKLSNHEVLISGLPEGASCRYRLVYPNGETSLTKETRSGRLDIESVELEHISSGGWLLRWHYPAGLVKTVVALNTKGRGDELKPLCNGGQWNVALPEDISSLEDIVLTLTLADDKERSFSLKSHLDRELRQIIVRLNGFDGASVVRQIDVAAPRKVKNNLKVIKNPLEKRLAQQRERSSYLRAAISKGRVFSLHCQLHMLSPLIFRTSMWPLEKQEEVYQAWTRTVPIFLYARARKALPPIEPAPFPDFGRLALKWRESEKLELVQILKEEEPVVYFGPRKALTDYVYKTTIMFEVELPRVDDGVLSINLKDGRYFLFYTKINGHKPLLIYDFVDRRETSDRTAYQFIPREYLKKGKNTFVFQSEHLYDVLSHLFTQVGKVSFSFIAHHRRTGQ